MTSPLQRFHQPIQGFSNFSQLGGYSFKAGHSVSNARMAPNVRVGLGVTPAPPNSAGATSFRAGGSRWRTERQHVLCDRHLSDASPDLSPERLGVCVKASRKAGSVGLFSLPVCVCQDQPGDSSKAHQSIVPPCVDNTTWRMQTCSVNANSCS